MKRTILYLASILLLGSCCHKDKCLEKPAPNVKLTGFTIDETDTVYIVYLGTPGDTLRTNGRYNADSSEMYLGYDILTVMGSDVIIPGANRQYRIDEASYITKKSECGRCLWQNKNDRVFSGCKVNGEAQGTQVTLAK